MNKRLQIAVLFVVGILPYEINGFYNPFIYNNKALFWSIDIMTFILMPLLVYGVGVRGGYFTNRDLGFHFDIKGREKSIPFFSSLVLLPPLFYLGFLGFRFLGFYIMEAGNPQFVFDFSQAVDGQGLNRFTQVFYISITAGLVEEFYYRGMFKLLFKPGVAGNVAFVLLSSIIFSSVHWEGGVVKLFIAFMLGLMFSISYLWTKNIWPLVIAHSGTDFILFY